MWFQINLCILIGLAWLIQYRGGLARTAFRWRWTILAVGTVLVVSDFLYFTALHQPGVPISIASPIRRSNCVVSFLLGGVLFNDQNRKAKFMALAMIIVGVVFLCMGK